MTTNDESKGRGGASKLRAKAAVWCLAWGLLVPSFGCGAQAGGGNSGSETHWLSQCASDAECGEFSCLCGVCTVGCESDATCEVDDGASAECATPAALVAAGFCERPPARALCIGTGALVPADADGGPVAPARDASMADDDSPVADDDSPVVDDDGRTDGGEPSPVRDASTTDAGPVTPPPVPAGICDGSDAIRLVTQQVGGGGLLAPEVSWVSGYGWRWLAIDGRCNFWGTTEVGIVFEGVIDEPSLLADYEATNYGKLTGLTEYRPGICNDAPLDVLWDPSGLLVGAPCTGMDPPAGWRAAFDGSAALLDTLMKRAQRSEGPLRAYFVQASDSEQRTKVQWPLSLDPTPVVRPAPPALEELTGVDVGVLIAPGATARALRSAAAPDVYPTLFEVPSASGTPSWVDGFLRDEPPPRVRAALASLATRAWLDPADVGIACTEEATCAAGLMCLEDGSGEQNCNSCVLPDEPTALCTSNADCCGGLVCCVDCAELSGTCVVAPDPCRVCLDNGGAWIASSEECAVALCEPDSSCFSDDCPQPCAPDSCGGCFDLEACWAAGCTWQSGGEVGSCAALDPEPPAEPCFVDVSDPLLPGVTVHLEADRCAFRTGMGGQFRYTVELLQSLDFTTLSSDGGCGLCWEATSVETWLDFRIQGADATYCPECEGGCCAPNEAEPITLDSQSLSGTVDWPGLQWLGPSDTGNEPSGAFPPGEYSATVRLRLPGVGELSATLPIVVTPDLQR